MNFEEHIKRQMIEQKKQSIDDVLNGNITEAYNRDPYVNYLVHTIMAAREHEYPIQFFRILVEFSERMYFKKMLAKEAELEKRDIIPHG